MSIQSDSVPSGPGLTVSNGLSANQSGGTAQAQHHPNHHAHDPYPGYAQYSVSPSYGSAYASNVNPMPQAHYYSHSAQAHHYPHETSQPRLHREQSGAQAAHRGTQHHEPTRQEHIHTSSHGRQHSTTYRSPSDPDPSSPSPSVSPGTPNAPTKRGPPISPASSEEHSPATKKHKSHASNVQGHHDEGDDNTKDESGVGPGGGAKHWTDEEKSKLFHWMLTNDERWELFGSKMNTVFREGSAELFGGRKSFTALKSCYHRNLDVFKQIYAFEAFLAKSPLMSVPPEPTGAPSPSSSIDAAGQDISDEPLPPSFASPAVRQAFLERKIDVARSMNVPIGNLTVRVLDHWQAKGWYALFKKRFREDPRTGLPIPRHVHVPLHRNENGAAVVSGGNRGRNEDERSAPSTQCTSPPSPVDDSLTEAQRRHLDPLDCLIPAPFTSSHSNVPRGMSSAGRSHRTPPPVSQSSQPLPITPASSQLSPHVPSYSYPPPPGPVPFYPSPIPGDYYQHLNSQAQTAQAITQLTNMTHALLGTCNTLTDLVRAQNELLQRREERDETGSQPTALANESQRAALATDMLANPRAPDEVKKLAADYLKRLFQ